MKHILEIFHAGDCLEQREYPPGTLIVPEVGDRIFIALQDRGHSEECGPWWIVKSRTHLLMSPQDGQTVQLFCEPDPSQGKRG